MGAMSVGGFPMRRIFEWGPHGHFRFVVTILTDNLNSQSSIFSLSLGQSLPPARPREAVPLASVS
jgi:hypothetical protein